MPAQATVRERLAALHSDRDVGRWYKDHRSVSTARVQLEQLELFCRRTESDPHALVRLARRLKDFQDLVLGWLERQRKSGHPDSYSAAIWAAIRSWLKYNDAAPDWQPKFRIRNGTTLASEVVPTPEQLRQVVSVLSVRDRAAALMIAHTGIRVGALASRFETAGLKLGDLPELRLDARPKFERIPFLVRVPAELSKSGTGYLTFGTQETADAILAYLTERAAPKRRRLPNLRKWVEAPGEKLTAQSPLIAPEPKAAHTNFRRDREGSLFISEKSLSTDIRKAMRKVAPPGVRWRTYVLRAYFSTQMELAERHGLITRTLRESFMGHTLGVDGAYNVRKPLSSERLEELRSAYKRASVYLLTSTESEEDRVARGVIRMLLKRAGLPEDTPLSELAALSRTGGRADGPADALLVPPSQPAQRLVSNGELGRLLAQGWTFVSPVGADQAVVRWPHGDPAPGPQPVVGAARSRVGPAETGRFGTDYSPVD